ncbi:hypothetical protein ACLMJK_007335 [Lecanora helva]
MAYTYYPPLAPTRPPTYSASQSSASLVLETPLGLTWHHHPRGSKNTSQCTSQCTSPTTNQTPASDSVPPTPEEPSSPAGTRPPTPTMPPCTRQHATVQLHPRPVLAERQRGPQKNCERDPCACEALNNANVDVSPTSTSASTRNHTAATTAATSLESLPLLPPKKKQDQCTRTRDHPQPPSYQTFPLSEDPLLLTLETSISSRPRYLSLSNPAFPPPLISSPYPYLLPENSHPIPHLPAHTARNNALLHRDHVNSIRYLYTPRPLSEVHPPLTRHDKIIYHNGRGDGWYTIVRYGNIKPNQIRDWWEGEVWDRGLKWCGWRGRGDWETRCRDRARERRKWIHEQRTRWWEWAVMPLVWVVVKVREWRRRRRGEGVDWGALWGCNYCSA